MSTTSPARPVPVRLALVGLGGHGRTIQGAAEAAPGLDVVAVYDPDAAEASRSAAHFGCDASPSYEALLARGDLDAVSLCSPNALHRPQAEAAFAAGLDVFVEKPIANTVADGTAIVEAAEATGRVLMVGHNMRFGEAVRWGRGLLRDGRLGEVVSAEVHFSSDTGLRLPPDSWRLRPEACPVLPMMQLGVHGIDLLHDLVGPATSVFARARGLTTPPGVVDNVVALLELTGDVPATVVSNYCSPVEFSLRVTGTEGTLAGTPTHLRFTPRDGTPGDAYDASADGFASYAAQMQVFAESVQGRRQPDSHGWGGTQALAVVEAIEASLAQGAPVPVALVGPHSL